MIPEWTVTGPGTAADLVAWAAVGCALLFGSLLLIADLRAGRPSAQGRRVKGPGMSRGRRRTDTRTRRPASSPRSLP